LLPESAAVSVSWPVVAFTAALAVVTGLVFGVAPAMLASRPDLTAALGQGTRLSSDGVGVSRTQWLRSGLVAAEMALALILLAGSGLLVRSFMLLSAQPTGFQSDRILTAMVTLPPARYPTGDARKQFWLDLGNRLQTLPGVSESIESTALPFSNWEWQYDFTVRGREGVPNDGAGYRVVSGNYFSALGIPLLRGRAFTSGDAPGAEPAMIVSDVFATKHLGAADPIGQQISIGKTWRTVVGVVGSTRHRGLDEDLRAEMYVPLAQESAAPSSMLFAVKTQSDPNTLVPGVRATLTQLDPLLPLESVKTMKELISATVAERRFLMALLSLFASVAALLAAIGVYGVMTFVVNHSRRAIGIRLALGARPSQVQRGMVRSAATVVVAGAAAGLSASLMISKLIASQLFVISPRDPWTLTAVSAVLIAGALLSCWLPTRATSRVDPSSALRSE
jgi:putative ABC transport system permease protein